MATSYDHRSEGEKGRYPHGFDKQVGALAEAPHHAQSRGELLEVFANGVAGAVSAGLAGVVEYNSGKASLVLGAGPGFSSDRLASYRFPDGLRCQAGRTRIGPHERAMSLEDFARPHDWSDEPILASNGAKSGISAKNSDEQRTFGVLGTFFIMRRGKPRTREWGPAARPGRVRFGS